MHENGPYYVENKTIKSHYTTLALSKDPTILIDTDCGTLLKIGTKKFVTDYFNTMCTEYIKTGLSNMTNAMKVITFLVNHDKSESAPDSYNLNINEVCTVLNYFNNSIGAKAMNEFLSLPLCQMIMQIYKLQKIGF